MIADIWKYQILTYIDKQTFYNLITSNNELYTYCMYGLTSFSYYIRSCEKIKDYTINAKIDIFIENTNDKDILLKYQNKIISIHMKNDIIYDFSIFNNLLKLELHYSQIDDNILKKIKFVNTLILLESNNITDEGIIHLPLKKLRCNKNITNYALLKLKNIKELDISENNLITNDGISHLKLIKLKCNNNITDNDLYNQISLTYLHLSINTKITDNSIKKLYNLEKICSGTNNNITFQCINNLPNIKCIGQGYINELCENVSNLNPKIEKIYNDSIKRDAKYYNIEYPFIIIAGCRDPCNFLSLIYNYPQFSFNNDRWDHYI